MIEDNWWLMIIDDWWWLTMIDDDWRWLMMIDDDDDGFPRNDHIFSYIFTQNMLLNFF